MKLQKGLIMQKRSVREWTARMVILVLGLVIAHLGVTLFMLTELGADPFNVMIQGLAKHLPVSHGITHMAVCCLIILVLLAVDRSYIKAGTLVCMAFGGPIIDGFTLVLNSVVNGTLPLILRLVTVVIACVILAFGMTIVIQSDAGTGPNDLVAVVLSDKLKRKFGIVRVAVDVSFVVVGVLLGGIFGIGTLVCAFVVGTAAGILMPVSMQLVSRGLKMIGKISEEDGKIRTP